MGKGKGKNKVLVKASMLFSPTLLTFWQNILGTKCLAIKHYGFIYWPLFSACNIKVFFLQ